MTSNNVTAYLALGRPHLSTVIVSARLLVLAGAAAVIVSGQGMSVGGVCRTDRCAGQPAGQPTDPLRGN